MALPEMYFCTHVWTNGPIPGEHSVTAIGVAVVGRPSSTYYVELKPISEDFDPDVMAASGLTMEHLLENGQDPVEAMQDFAEWVQSMAGNTYEAVFVGFHAPFDWMFIHWTLIRLVGSDPFGTRIVDIPSFYMGLASRTFEQATLQDMSVLFPIGQEEGQNALENARLYAGIFEKMLEMQHRPPQRR